MRNLRNLPHAAGGCDRRPDLVHGQPARPGRRNLVRLVQTRPVREQRIRDLSPEDLLRCKPYVMQRDHCDWSDVINLLHARGRSLDWARLLGRVGLDFPLLKSAGTLFDWLCPNRAAEFPGRIRRQFQIPPSTVVSPKEEQRRARLLDSRGWFAPILPTDVPLEV